jgi:hypothetical protein
MRHIYILWAFLPIFFRIFIEFKVFKKFILKLCLRFFRFFNLHQWMWGVVYFQARTENGQGPNPIFWFYWIHDFNKHIVVKHAIKNNSKLKVNRSKQKNDQIKKNTKPFKIFCEFYKIHPPTYKYLPIF